ncbi:hypothetical protein LOTGIDRAFT_173557 [Lottia gigantea]|uniref:Large ribosomal subunit protein mL42 n=1 Tax=Lottia gigantea TaxID=225164 RepID=V4CCT3_LOTGI|nr:hypothetical protein LOTGIDRAFT_173557 [Lottia gigantea]ESO99719.1 hypothetical protein LOTGIDRAFT_173557 [Lottia gigantea]
MGYLYNVSSVLSSNSSLTNYSDDSSSKSKKKPVTHSCLSPDKSAILCWHPEQEFPYEHTRPVPRNPIELAQGETVLKIQYVRDAQMINKRPEGPNDVELANILYETKHRFFPKPGKKYRKVNPPKDRDSL